MLSRLEQLANASTVVASAQRAAGRYFYFKTLPSDNNRKLYVPVGGSERLLVDPEKKSTTAAHYSLDRLLCAVDRPDGLWINQVGRNLTDAADGLLNGKRYLLHGRDPLFTAEFLSMLAEAGVQPPGTEQSIIRTLRVGRVGLHGKFSRQRQMV